MVESYLVRIYRRERAECKEGESDKVLIHGTMENIAKNREFAFHDTDQLTALLRREIMNTVNDD